MPSENNRQIFLQVKQKLDFYHLPTNFPIQATQLLYKILNKLDIKNKNDTDRTRQSNFNLKDQTQNEKIINLKIRKLIGENSKLHYQLIQSNERIQILKDCIKNSENHIKGENVWENNIINHLKERQLQLFQQVSQIKFKYNQLMDLIHEDPNIQKKYLKKLLKHKKLTIQNIEREPNIQSNTTYKNTNQKNQNNQFSKLKILNKNLSIKIQNRQLEILRLQKLIQKQINVQSILKINQFNRLKQDLQNLKYQNDLLMNKLTNTQSKTLSKQKINKKIVVQKLKSPNKASFDRQQQNQNQIFLNKIIKLQNKNKLMEKQNIQLKKQLQVKSKQLKQQKKINNNRNKIIKLNENKSQTNKNQYLNQANNNGNTSQANKNGDTNKVNKNQNQISFQNQMIRDKYNNFSNQQLWSQKIRDQMNKKMKDQILQMDKKIKQLSIEVQQKNNTCALLNQQNSIKSQAISNLQRIIQQLSICLNQQQLANSQQKQYNQRQLNYLKHSNLNTQKYPPKLIKQSNQKQKKQRKGSLDSIKKTNLKTTNVLTTQVKQTLKSIEQQKPDTKIINPFFNRSEYGAFQDENKTFSENVQLDIKSDFDNNYPSNIHSKITEFKREKQSSSQNSEQNPANTNFKISVTKPKSGQKIPKQYLYQPKSSNQNQVNQNQIQQKQSNKIQPKIQYNQVNENKTTKQLTKKAEKIEVLRQQTAEEAIKNIKNQQKQTYKELQIQPLDQSDKASVFSMRKQIDQLKIENRKENKQKKKMQKQIKDLQEQRDRFQSQIKLIQEKNSLFSGGDFPKIIKQQEARISELQQSNIQTELKIKDKDLKISNLEAKLQNLTQKVQNLTSNLLKLEEENHQLRKEREKLLQRQKQYMDSKNQQLMIKMQNQEKQNRSNSLEYSSQILWLKKQVKINLQKVKNLEQKIQKYTETINQLNDFITIHRKEKEKLSIQKIGYLKQNQYLKKKLVQLQRALSIQSQQMQRYRQSLND